MVGILQSLLGQKVAEIKSGIITIREHLAEYKYLSIWETKFIFIYLYLFKLNVKWKCKSVYCEGINDITCSAMCKIFKMFSNF